MNKNKEPLKTIDVEEAKKILTEEKEDRLNRVASLIQNILKEESVEIKINLELKGNLIVPSIYLDILS